MKSDLYVCLPLLVTLFNLAFVLFGLPKPVNGQSIDLSQDVALNACVESDDDTCRYLDLSDSSEKNPRKAYATESPQEDVYANLFPQDPMEVEEEEEEEEEKDPMLQKMPGLDFEAYVRADIATFYNKEPGSMKEFTPKFHGQAGKFVNMSPEPVALYWVDDHGNHSPINPSIGAWASAGTATFPGHKFVFTSRIKTDTILCSFSIKKGTSVYYYDPFSLPQNDKTWDPARGVPPEGTEARDLTTLPSNAAEKYLAQKFNFAFAALYKNFTGGSEWLSMYPRNKPLHKIWRADYFGQTHHVITRESHFHTDPGADLTEHTLSIAEMRRNESAPLALAEYRDPKSLNMTLTAISCAPRAFEIRNFLSEVEVDHLVNLVNKQSFQRSSTGEAGSSGHVSNVRTSRNTWIPRHKDLVLNSIYQRAADALRLNEALLRNREEGEMEDYFPTKTLRAINEDLQVVHYDPGQEYTAHHDFSFPRGNHPDSPSRSINFCMYLTDVKKGGETSFVRWRSGETSDAISVTPEKGKAMIFYMVNPDGNLDDLSQHAALPVIEGEKLFVNLWIHDPFRS